MKKLVSMLAVLLAFYSTPTFAVDPIPAPWCAGGFETVLWPQKPPHVVFKYPGVYYERTVTERPYVGLPYDVALETRLAGQPLAKSTSNPYPLSLIVTAGTLYVGECTGIVVANPDNRCGLVDDWTFRMLYQGYEADRATPVRWTTGVIEQTFYVKSYSNIGPMGESPNVAQPITIFAHYNTSWDTYDFTWRRDGSLHVKQKQCSALGYVKRGPGGSEDLVPVVNALAADGVTEITPEDGVHTLKLEVDRDWPTPPPFTPCTRFRLYIDDVLQVTYCDDAPPFGSGVFGVRTDATIIELAPPLISGW